MIQGFKQGCYRIEKNKDKFREAPRQENVDHRLKSLEHVRQWAELHAAPGDEQRYQHILQERQIKDENKGDYNNKSQGNKNRYLH